MTELLQPVEAPSDAELISRVRGGDLDAYGLLYERHVDAARRLSRQLVRGPDSDDLVSEAFAKVMGVLQNGGGPDVAFRAYLLTAVRRLHVDRIRGQARVTSADDMTPFDPGIPFQDTAVEQFESGAAAKAFASLPERWQLVLWHLEVEGQKPADIAPLLGMSANSVSALAYRAREGLRQAFLSAHLADTAEANCRWVTEHLGAYVRHGLSKRDAAKVEDHLQECRSCTAMFLELTEVNSNLSGIIAPLLLGSLAAGYLASAGGGALAAGGALAVVGRVRDFVVANAVPVAAGTAAATVAVATAVALTVVDDDGRPVAGPAPGDTTSSSAPDTAPEDPADTAAPPSQRERRAASPTARATRPFETSTAVPVLATTGASASAPAPSDSTIPSQGPTDGPTGPSGEPTGGPTDGPTNPPGPEADVTLTSAGVSDNALVINVRGLPEQPVTIGVDLESQSGRTRFEQVDGTCSVRAGGDRTHATCVTSTGAARTAVFERAPADFQGVIPLDFPKDLASDRLRVTVGVDGYTDRDAADNTRVFDYARPTPTDTSSPTPTDTSSPTPTDTSSPTPTDTSSPTPTDTSSPTPTDTSSPTPTDTSSPTPTDTSSPTPTDTGSPTPTDTGSPTPTDTGSPTPTTPPDGYDLSLSLSRHWADLGIGRFRAQVTGLPTAGTHPTVRFAMNFDDGRVDLEGIPGGCSFVGGSRSLVDCRTTGHTWNGTFDADLRGTDLSVWVTVHASIPGNDDPDDSDNTRSIILGRFDDD